MLANDAMWIDGGVRTPGRLARLLAGVPRAPTMGATLVHTGALDRPIAQDVARALESDVVRVVIDLAWVGSSAGWWHLRPWRREPPRRDAALRLGWITGLGVTSPQQWVCTSPLPVVVTVAALR
jgi:hypothetical protein